MFKMIKIFLFFSLLIPAISHAVDFNDDNFSSRPKFQTVNTGQGNYELYGMDQDVTTVSTVTHSSMTITNQVNSASFKIGANDLTTSEWANLDGQDQGVKTSDTAEFAAIKIATDVASGVIHALGDVTIKQTTDGFPFHGLMIRGTGSDYLNIYGTNSDYAGIQAGDDGAYRDILINQYGGNVGIATDTASVALEVNGTIIGDMYYGGMYVINGSTTPEMVQNTWYHVTNDSNDFFTAMDLNGFTVTNDRIVISRAGYYKVDFGASYSGANTDIYEVGVSTDSAAPAKVRTKRGMSSSDSGVVSGTGIFNLAASATLELQIRNTANGNDATITDAQMTVLYVGN